MTQQYFPQLHVRAPSVHFPIDLDVFFADDYDEAVRCTFARCSGRLYAHNSLEKGRLAGLSRLRRMGFTASGRRDPWLSAFLQEIPQSLRRRVS